MNNPVAVADNANHPELASITKTRTKCVADAQISVTEATSSGADLTDWAHNRREACMQTAVERCAELPRFTRADCHTHITNLGVAPGSALGRVLARAGIDKDVKRVVVVVFEISSMLAMFAVPVVYLLATWIGAVHGFSPRRARWITVAMVFGTTAIVANLDNLGVLAHFDPLLEFLDALS